jgi:starch-binding outer membrane protein, SusD/RagB family
MTHTYNTSRRKRAGWAPGRALPVVSGMLLALSLGACDSKRVLQVTDPDVAKPPALVGTAAIPTLYAGAVGDFAVAYGGNTTTEGELGYSALLTDEYLNAETFPTRIEIDQRNTTPDNANIVAVFRATEKARASADFASTKIAAANPNDVRRSETMSLAGFAIDFLGEDYCSGSPISLLTENTVLIFGAPQTTAQLWDDAISKFDSAITIALAAGTSGTTQLNLARIGKARALVNKGDYAGAAVVVGATGPSGAAVPTNFVYLVRYSTNTNRENNGVFFWNQNNARFSPTDVEGINGLPYRSSGDPRVLETRTAGARTAAATGFDGVTPLWLANMAPNTWAPQGKYAFRDASMPLATGLEARLIESEAALAAGDLVGYLAGINAEQTAQAVTLSTLPATTAAQQDLLFKERAYSLWLTAHRLGDMRRLIRQYGRNSETVFPTGTFFHSGSAAGNYGTDVNLILPNQELNNPSFHGCIDRAA